MTRGAKRKLKREIAFIATTIQYMPYPAFWHSILRDKIARLANV